MPRPLFRDILRAAREGLGWSEARAASEVSDALGRGISRGMYRNFEASPHLPRDPRVFRAACTAVGLDTGDVLARLGFMEVRR